MIKKSPQLSASSYVSQGQVYDSTFRTQGLFYICNSTWVLNDSELKGYSIYVIAPEFRILG